MTDAQQALAQVREALAAGPTPGPWRWEVSAHSKRLQLVGGLRPQYDLTVMGFTRWGMSGATVKLRDLTPSGMDLLYRLHERADWIAPIPGREHHANWCSTVTHPDAAFIAKCNPENVAAILAHVEAQAAEIERLQVGIELIEAADADLRTKLDAASDLAEMIASERDEARAERDELRRQLAEAGESIAAQARTIADLRGALIESREMIRVDRDSLYETSANPDGTIDCEDDRKALAEYDDVLALIGETLDAAIDAAMGSNMTDALKEPRDQR